MKPGTPAFRPQRSADWTKERVEKLGKTEIQQLRANAGDRGADEVVALCDEALRTLPKATRKGDAAASKGAKGKRLVSRGKAFEARGVHLQDPRTSWGGIRKSDGAVVMSMWAAGVESRNGGCSYRLWAPNTDNSRPWSDTASGRARLKHCELARERGGAEGLLVHGELLEGSQPEEKARSVHGVDPETVVHFKVEKHGDEYWATWGKKPL